MVPVVLLAEPLLLVVVLLVLVLLVTLLLVLLRGWLTQLCWRRALLSLLVLVRRCCRPCLRGRGGMRMVGWCHQLVCVRDVGEHAQWLPLWRKGGSAVIPLSFL